MLNTLAPLMRTDLLPIVLVHGVGIGPESFVELAELLVASGRVVHIVHRPGYDGDTPGRELRVSLTEQVDTIVEEVAAAGSPAFVWVGVSGGATLGVLALQRHSPSLAGAVLHEPLVGSVAPRLAAAVNASALQLRAETGTAGALEFMERLIGASAWASLGHGLRGSVARRRALITAEVPEFAAFEPDAASMACHGSRVVLSVGERSPEVRHEAVAQAAAALRSVVSVVRESGHLPQIESAERFAQVIRSSI